eukprot:119738_1
MKSVVLVIFLIPLYAMHREIMVNKTNEQNNEDNSSDTDSSVGYLSALNTPRHIEASQVVKPVVKPLVPFKDPLEPTMYIKINDQLIPAYPNWPVCYYTEVRPLPQDSRYCIQCSCYLQLVSGESKWSTFHVAGTKEVMFNTDGGSNNCEGVFGSSEYSLK